MTEQEKSAQEKMAATGAVYASPEERGLDAASGFAEYPYTYAHDGGSAEREPMMACVYAGPESMDRPAEEPKKKGSFLSRLFKRKG